MDRTHQAEKFSKLQDLGIPISVVLLVAVFAAYITSLGWRPILHTPEMRVPRDMERYAAAQRNRLDSIRELRPSEAELGAVANSITQAQCVPASMYTVLRNPPYATFVRGFGDALQSSGVPFSKMRSVLSAHDLSSVYYKSYFEVEKLVRQVANDLDDGKVVLLSTNSAVVMRAVGGNPQDPQGTGHIVRVISVFRDYSGEPFEFGLYDVNIADRSPRISAHDLQRILSNKIFSVGVFVSERSVLPPIH